MKYWVYVLKSRSKNWIYAGMTSNIERRLVDHNSRKVKSTKNKAPFDLVYKEKCPDSKSARKREKYFKSCAGKELLKRRLLFTLSCYLYIMYKLL